MLNQEKIKKHFSAFLFFVPIFIAVGMSIPEIGTNLANAAAEITAAEALLEEPFSSHREFRDTLSKVVKAIGNFNNVHRNSNYKQRANAISSIWLMYRNGPMLTYYSAARTASSIIPPAIPCCWISVITAAGPLSLLPFNRRTGARAPGLPLTRATPTAASLTA